MKAAIIATAAVALLAAACGGSPSSAGRSPDAGGSAGPASAVAYSHCIRSHDLSAHGFSRQQAHSPQIRAKVSECEQQMPSGLPEG